MSEHYYSALKTPLDLPELERHTKNGSHAIKHDLNDGVLKSFKNCDVIYSEPAWRHGYKKFHERANIEMKTTYNEYLESITNLIKELGKPSYIVTGQHAVKKLNPDRSVPIKLYKHNAVLCIWNEGKKISAPTNTLLLEELSKNYKKILDFSSGYGIVCRFFKKFVCTDIGGQCIYYIAKTFMGYDKK